MTKMHIPSCTRTLLTTKIYPTVIVPSLESASLAESMLDTYLTAASDCDLERQREEEYNRAKNNSSNYITTNIYN
jgi:hypothetical protein